MRSTGILAVGTAAALLLACGARPATYLVALDQSALTTLPGSCYATGTPPTTPPNLPPLVQHEFTVWEGAQNKRYLEIDPTVVRFPSSTFNISGLEEGGPKNWTYTTVADRGNNLIETRQLAFTFIDLSSTLVGSIAATLTYTCSTPPCTSQDCSATLPLNGRQIDAQPTGQL